jgi:hypothetical protein
LIGTTSATVIATRTRPSQAPMGRRPSEAVALFEIATATTKAVAFAFAALGGIIVIAALGLVLLLVL